MSSLNLPRKSLNQISLSSLYKVKLKEHYPEKLTGLDIRFHRLINNRLLTVVWPEANQSTSQPKTNGEKMMEFVFQKRKKGKK